MLRISDHRSIIVAFAGFAGLFALGETFAVNAQNPSSGAAALQIIASSIAATERHWQARLHYSYMERDESRRRDVGGNVTSESVEVSRTIPINGAPFEQLVERNGRPPSAGEERKQQAELDKLKRETPAQRAERLGKQAEENASLVGEVTRAFDFQLAGEEAVNGRPAYVLHATPFPGYQARGPYGKMFSKVAGKLWVDKQELGWVKVDGHVMAPFSMGGFLVRLLRGSQITMEQMRVGDGLWMLERVEMRGVARIFFVKSLVMDRVLTYSEYRLADGGRSSTVEAELP